MNAAEDVPTRPGDILAGKYRVEKILGSGAMGVVVAAMHEELRELRAIKFMLPSMLSDAEGVERFLREARAAVRLKSQHVAKIHDIGRLETGAPYMVMEYLEGSDLKQLLEARGALPVHEAVGYMLQICEAIAEAHALGIVHRDLKPANLFLTRGAGGAPCIKVLDFGIAKVIGGGPDAGDMTRTSALLGTPLYMSPEQMRGARSIDGRSDVWALGAILYRMLTGRTPFSGSSVTEICAAVVADQPDAPAMLRPDIPPALEAAVMCCLEKSPARRFATAAQFAAAIAPFAAPVAAPQPQRLSPALNGTAILDASAAVPFAAAARPVAAVAPPVAAPVAMMQQAAPRPAPIAAPPASVPVAIAAAAPIAVPAPPVAPSAAGNTTQASTWTQAGAAPAAPKSSGKGALIAALAVVILGGAAAVAAMQFARKPAPPQVAAPVVTVTAAAPSAEPSAAPTASAEPSASAAPTAEPSATATATAAPQAAPSAAAVKPPAVARPGPAGGFAPTKGKAKDAFGSERK